jgi:preprotein translocase subunit SecA
LLGGSIQRELTERRVRRVIEWRRAILVSEVVPKIWKRAPGRCGSLVAAVGDQAVLHAEGAVTLACIDRAWRDHLAFCAELGEGIHLVRLAGEDPLTGFASHAIRAYSRMDEAIDQAVLAALSSVRITGGSIDLTGTGLIQPSSTWTYLLSETPLPQSHRDDAHRSRRGHAGHLFGGIADAVLDRVGAG